MTQFKDRKSAHKTTVYKMVIWPWFRWLWNLQHWEKQTEIGFYVTVEDAEVRSRGKRGIVKKKAIDSRKISD